MQGSRSTEAHDSRFSLRHFYLDQHPETRYFAHSEIRLLAVAISPAWVYNMHGVNGGVCLAERSIDGSLGSLVAHDEVSRPKPLTRCASPMGWVA